MHSSPFEHDPPHAPVLGSCVHLTGIVVVVVVVVVSSHVQYEPACVRYCFFTHISPFGQLPTHTPFFASKTQVGCVVVVVVVVVVFSGESTHPQYPPGWESAWINEHVCPAGHVPLEHLVEAV